MSPVHPQGGRRPNFGQPVPCPTPGRIDRNSTVLNYNIHINGGNSNALNLSEDY